MRDLGISSLIQFYSSQIKNRKAKGVDEIAIEVWKISEIATESREDKRHSYRKVWKISDIATESMEDKRHSYRKYGR